MRSVLVFMATPPCAVSPPGSMDDMAPGDPSSDESAQSYRDGLVENAFATATRMLAALRARRVSAGVLLALHQRRIERNNPTRNAIVEADFARAATPRPPAPGARAATRPPSSGCP